ncbi:TAXI family TRAP transporter solute-binding subunit [Vreelandella maris]|uniref:TAXI family TRAP transporter solute-binding subunit n=1 Tax=Vreelandella maris TaxID=2729617 RepID=A0A7Y6RF36_9GAMM|nr:TAXI family TRAP transporter solute-binding subunit [Halomonas maris]NVF15799.1 TAXI family TRAP transporter solute-binding subunit [Halomonas maris]|tara:strand:+ start:3146 stop:4126 length:981 start_codon:yes stop_codon:yes gene_type:complete
MKMKKTNLAVGAISLAISSIAFANEDRSDWPSSLVMGTASQGGTYYIYGAGLANLISQELDINLGTEVTGGPAQNVSMVQMGEHDFGLTTLGPAQEAIEGKSPVMAGVEHENIRAVIPMYSSIFHYAALEQSGITSVADLEGKRLGVGPAGGTNSVYVPRILEFLGYDVTTIDGGISDQGGQIQDGLLDGFAQAGGVPLAAISQLEAQAEVNIFAYSENEIERLLEEFPVLSRADLPAGGYASLDEDVPTVAMWSFVITHADAPESLVYEVVKTVMENSEAVAQIHRSAEETVAENYINNSAIPFHPGAVRWFEENGYEIPEDLKG